jgi:hypothetical protein
VCAYWLIVTADIFKDMLDGIDEWLDLLNIVPVEGVDAADDGDLDELDDYLLERGASPAKKRRRDEY